MILVDADGCALNAGVTTWMPWRWGNVITFHVPKARRTCQLGRRRAARMRDPEDGDMLGRAHEMPFEVCEKCGAAGGCPCYGVER